jgi:hypothetical protein
MADNPLKYTGLTYSDIMTQINSLIASDPRFDNFKDSSVAKFLVEMFAGTTDITNYYLQRRAEECYFDSAQHKSSVISLARMFGYDMTRSIPATAKLKIIVKGDLTQDITAANQQIQIPVYAKFNVGGNSFILQDTYAHTITATELANIVAQGDDFSLSLTIDSFNNSINIVQGEIKETVIDGSTNTQLGATFQRYLIEDKEFSNLYGTGDYFHNKVTRVYVGENKIDPDIGIDGTLFSIDRRSLINWENIAKSNTLDTTQGTRVCLMRTTPDENIEIVFGNGGDNGFAHLGAINPSDNVYIQYLATKGSAANAVGVIGDSVSYAGKVYTTNGTNIASKTKFELVTNIMGGADNEDIQSIKYSAPKIYYSLDRLVSKADYIAYLKTLTTPINVKNAVAWGEQEQRGRDFADLKSYNAAFFSVLASLYNFPAGDNSSYSVKMTGNDIDDAVLDDNYDENKIQTQSFFNVYTRNLMAKQVKVYQVEPVIYDRGIKNQLADEVTSASFIQSLITIGSAPLNFTYSSDLMVNASNISASTYVIVKFDDVSDSTTLDAIATKIKDAIIAQVSADVRGTPETNANYGMSAFNSSMTASFDYDEDTGTFIFNLLIGDAQTAPCYIAKFDTQSLLMIALNISSDQTTNVYRTNTITDESISDKIVSVVKNLSERSQITVANIYMSPIIHSFELSGTVYVKPLFDKEEIRRQVNNNIYKWLDTNADFNVSIQKSNITQIIEDNSAVVRVDFDMVPTKTSKMGKPYNTDLMTNPSVGATALATIVSTVFSPYLTSGVSATSVTEDIFFNVLMSEFDAIITTATTLTEDDYAFIYVNQTVIDGVTYKLSDYSSYAEYKSALESRNTITDYSGYMLEVLNSIRESMGFNIKQNLLNSYGNIGILDADEVHGKYTIGSEIVKLDCSKLKYVYK